MNTFVNYFNDKTIPEKYRINRLKGLVFLIVIVLITIIYSLSQLFKSDADIEAEIKDYAYDYSQIVCKTKLISPSSATFPYEAVSIVKLKDSLYLVSSYVDSQNEFNATVRNNYTCKIKYVGGDYEQTASWYMVDFVTY